MAIKLKKDKRKVWLALPCYGGTIHVCTMKSIVHDMFPIVLSGVDIKIFDELGHADIYLLRAQIVEHFLNDEDATDLVMIDSDVGWAPGGLQKLLAHDVDVVAGAYPKRQEPVTFMFRSALDYGGKLLGDPETGLIEVYGMPGGFMRMKRHVLEKMRDHYGPQLTMTDGITPTKRVTRLFDPYVIEDKYGRRSLSEDYAFCQRWRDIGGKVHLDASIGMIHVGNRIYEGRLGEFITRENTISEQEAARADTEAA